MTIEEVKAFYSMRDVVDLYGLRPNRAGFICCPFHGEKTASMKIYDRSYHCYGCGAHGDVIDFVAGMDRCGFEEAFKKLGGTHEPPTKTASIRKRRRSAAKKRAEAEKQRLAERYQDVCEDRQMMQRIADKSEPLGNMWTFATNWILFLDYKANCLLEEMLNEASR